MKYLIILVLAIGAYKYYQHTHANPFIGKWKSNKTLTMAELEKTNITSHQKNFFRKIYGKMTLEIREDEWISTFDGKAHTAAYKIISKDGSCYQIEQEEDGKMNGGEICILEGNMYMPMERLDAKEVFTRI